MNPSVTQTTCLHPKPTGRRDACVTRTAAAQLGQIASIASAAKRRRLYERPTAKSPPAAIRVGIAGDG